MKGPLSYELLRLKRDGALTSEMSCLLQNLYEEEEGEDDCVSESHPFVSTTHNGNKKISNFKIITNRLNTLLRQFTMLFYIIFSQMYFCSVQNIMYSLFISHIPLDP